MKLRWEGRRWISEELGEGVCVCVWVNMFKIY